MKRKDVIIIAVLINLGLLAVLFIAAWKSPSDASVAANKENKNPVEQAVNIEQSVATSDVAISDQNAPAEDKLVHKLPQAVDEEKAVEETAKNYMEITVKRGDSLDKIAKTHHTSVTKLKEINNLSSNFLHLGQTLLIDKNSTKKTVTTNTSSPISDKQAQYYIVKIGDNPWTIAIKHHMKLNDLLKLNHLDSKAAKRLKAGDKLRVR
jgi:LysM repeat protein